MKFSFLVLLMASLLVSCGKKDSKDLEERAQRELMVENDNIEKRAMALESDLKRKQLFFTALAGVYEGSFVVEEKEFKTRLTLISNLPPYSSNRVRTMEEITTDLNNLTFSVQTTHWNSKGTTVAAGCIFSATRPDFFNGVAIASGEGCANIYRISMHDEDVVSKLEQVTERDVEVSGQVAAQKVLNKEVERIEKVFVVVQPTLSSKKFTTVLKRVAE